MNAALFLFALFPPPAACPFVFAIERGARAGAATDAGKTFRVERMHRHVVLLRIVLDLLARRVGQRTLIFAVPSTL